MFTPPPPSCHTALPLLPPSSLHHPSHFPSPPRWALVNELGVLDFHISSWLIIDDKITRDN